MSRVRIFLSSPSDVGYERARAERVAKRLSGLFDGLSIETYRWEGGHYFSAHQTFQTQIPETESFDLVVGILWSTLGSPLPSDWPVMADGRPYPSGTAFEILRAIEHRRRTDAALPDILVYKKSAGVTVSPDIDEEWDRIQNARKQLRAFFDEWFVSEQDGFKAAFAPFATADEFERIFEANLRDWLERNRKVGRERRWRVELAEMGSPFRGLQPFDARHSQVFFGRGPDVERARERLEDAVGRDSGFLLIEGASGSGKSSLARAGLLPRLALIDPTQRQAVLEPLSDAKVSPLSQIARALFAPGALPELSQSDFPTPALLSECLATGAAAAPIQSALDRAARALAEAEAHDSVPRLNLVLLVDQLEQIFSEAVSKNMREDFCSVLAALVATGRVRVIATLRADAVGDALSIPAFAELIDNGARLSLTAPARDALAEIIRAPAAAAGLSFETRHGGTSLDEVLLDTASGADALPLLQFTLEQLYVRARDRLLASGAVLGEVAADEPVLTLSFDDYEELGGIDGAIGHQADAALRKLPSSDRGHVARLLPRLVRSLVSGDTSAPVLMSPRFNEAAPTTELRQLAEALVQRRILVRDQIEGEDTLRLAHQRVLTAWDAAREALLDAGAFLRIRGDIERGYSRWEEGGRPRDLLLPSGARLAEAERILQDHADELPPELETYVRTSGRRARRVQRLTFAAAAVFAVTAGLALWSANNARIASEIAEDERVRADREAEDALRSAEIARQAGEEAATNARRAEAALEEAQRQLLVARVNGAKAAALEAARLQGQGRSAEALWQIANSFEGVPESDWPEIIRLSGIEDELHQARSASALVSVRQVTSSEPLPFHQASSRYSVAEAETGLVTITDTENGRDLPIESEWGRSECVAISPTQRLVTYCRRGGGLAVHDTTFGEDVVIPLPRTQLGFFSKEMDASVARVAFSEDGSLVYVLLTSSPDLRVYDAQDGRFSYRFQLPRFEDEDWLIEDFAVTGPEVITRAEPHTAALVPDARQLEAVWRLSEEDTVWPATQFHARDPLRRIRFSPDGRYAALGGNDGFLALRNTSTGAILKKYEERQGPITVVFSPDSFHVAEVFDNVARISALDDDNLRPLGEMHGKFIGGFVFTPDGADVIMLSFDGLVRASVAELETAEEILADAGRFEGIVGIARDGDVLVQIGDRRLAGIDANTGDLTDFIELAAPIDQVLLSPDATTLAIATLDADVDLRDATDAELLGRAENIAGSDGALLQFDASNRLIVAARWQPGLMLSFLEIDRVGASGLAVTPLPIPFVPVAVTLADSGDLAFLSDSGGVHLWHAPQDGPIVEVVRGYQEGRVFLNSQGDRLFVASQFGAANWEFDTDAAGPALRSILAGAAGWRAALNE